MILQSAGISGRGRAELAQVLSVGRRFIQPADAAEALEVDADTAAKKLARWAEAGWVRRVRRGLYIGVPVHVTNPAAWSEDPLLVAAEIWPPCYFTGWTAARHWALTEQVFRTTVLKTSERVRTSSVRLLDHNYIVRHVGDDALTWGIKTEWSGDARLRFADPARTVVDILDAPRLGETAAAANRRAAAFGGDVLVLVAPARPRPSDAPARCLPSPGPDGHSGRCGPFQPERQVQGDHKICGSGAVARPAGWAKSRAD
jgi:predicted transcriptional regulator of viral defense system